MGEGVLSLDALLPSFYLSQRHSPCRQATVPFRKVSHASVGCVPALLLTRHVTHAGWRWSDDVGEDHGDVSGGADEVICFEHGVALFNRGEYYQCHDVIESLWIKSAEPRRTVLHAILQCSVGLYHLLNRNHRGAMTEIGESLAKLRRQGFTAGPFFTFEQEVSALLEYIYNTQLDYAACTDDLCVTMDGSKESYQLLGNFAAGQALYAIQKAENDDSYLCFKSPYSLNLATNDSTAAHGKVKVPVLKITGEDFCRL